jgi:hypothetical protein
MVVWCGRVGEWVGWGEGRGGGSGVHAKGKKGRDGGLVSVLLW